MANKFKDMVDVADEFFAEDRKAQFNQFFPAVCGCPRMGHKNEDIGHDCPFCGEKVRMPTEAESGPTDKPLQDVSSKD